MVKRVEGRPERTESGRKHQRQEPGRPITSRVNRAEQQRRNKAVFPRKVRRVLEYVEKNFARDIRLDDMADLVKMSKCSFCRLFKRSTSMTFSEWVNLLRLEKAKQLLLSSDSYIFQVAHRAGFRSVNYFRILFRRHFGCSAREYKDRVRPP